MEILWRKGRSCPSYMTLLISSAAWTERRLTFMINSAFCDLEGTSTLLLDSFPKSESRNEHKLFCKVNVLRIRYCAVTDNGKHTHCFSEIASRRPIGWLSDFSYTTSTSYIPGWIQQNVALHEINHLHELGLLNIVVDKPPHNDNPVQRTWKTWSSPWPLHQSIPLSIYGCCVAIQDCMSGTECSALFSTPTIQKGFLWL